MKKLFRRITAVLTAAAVVFGSSLILPDGVLDGLGITASAASSGTCGTNLTWTLDNEGTLTISGEGAMTDYFQTGNGSSNSPFSNNTNIEKIVINEGVTSIGSFAFISCSRMINIDIPESVTSIGNMALAYCSGLKTVIIPDGVTNLGGVFWGCSGLTEIDIPDNVTCIDAAFFECAGLESITIPESVTSLDCQTFYGCSGLKSVTIPDSVTYIGENTFYGCSGLKEFTIPSSIISIGENAFAGCSNLECLTVSSIRNDLFTGDTSPFSQIGLETCNKLKTIIIADGTTSIPDKAFYDYNEHYREWNSRLTKIIIPDTVTSIGTAAFSGCSGLTQINIPDNVTYIGDGAFAVCEGLTKIEIPQGVTSIGEYTFNQCSGLNRITIPASVTSIGDSAFAYCTSLSDIYYTGTNVQWAAVEKTNASIRENCNIHYEYVRKRFTPPAKKYYNTGGDFVITGSSLTLINPDNTSYSVDVTADMFSGYNMYSTGIQTVTFTYEDYTDTFEINVGIFEIENGVLISYNGSEKDVTIPNIVTSIGRGAFSDKNITSITIPNSVSYIGEEAFYSCSGLTSITIPDSVTYIGDNAFSSCSKLETLTINLNNANAEGETPYNPYPRWTLSSIGLASCWEMTTINIAKGTTTIPDNAFKLDTYNIPSWQSKLTTITIPDTVISIGNNAFYGCSGLTALTIPDNVESIGENAFYGCTGLTMLTIPDSVTSIGEGAFSGCSGLESITLSGNITDIPGRAFAGCTGLTNIVIPDSVTHIVGNAFNECSNLINISLPCGVEFVIPYSSNAFYGCTSLESFTLTTTSGSDPYHAYYPLIDDAALAVCGNVIIADGITSIPENAFYDEIDNNLTSITLPSSVTSIGNYAFYNCSKLTSVTLSENLKSIGDYAFYNCWQLTSITLPENLETIGDYAFRGCGFTELVIPSGVTFIGRDAIESYELESLTLPVLDMDFDHYGMMEYLGGRGNFLKTITLTAGATSIPDNAFVGCTGLTSIILPDNITSIGAWAFGECSGLTSLIIPASVTSIGENAFGYCSSLTAITVSEDNENYTDINGVLFTKDGSQLLKYPAAKGVTNADAYTVPESVSSIGIGAFEQCSKLTSITILENVNSIGDNAFYLSSLTDIYFYGTEERWNEIVSSPRVPSNCTIHYGYAPTLNSISVTAPTKTVYDSDESIDPIGGKLTLSYSDSITKTIDLTAEMISGYDSTKPGEQTLTVTYDGLNDTFDIIVRGMTVVAPDITSYVLDRGGLDLHGGSITVYYASDNIVQVTMTDEMVSGYDRRTAGTQTITVTYDGFTGSFDVFVSEFDIDENGVLLRYLGSSAVITIPDEVTSIGERAFDGCSGLTSVTIPGTVTSIGERAFYGCSGLTNINIPSGVSTIANEAFYGCSGLTTLTLPDNLSSIGNSAFSGCSGLTSLSIPDDVTSIGFSAFEGCSSITSIIIPEGVTNIDSRTFNGCTNLESISIPDDIENIGEGAFRECSSLTSIVIPSGVTYMGGGLFSGCTDLETITIPLPSNCAENPLEGFGLTFCEKLTAIHIAEGTTAIPNRTFYGNNYGNPDSWNSRLTTITIPDTVTSIGDEAFRGCSGLTALSIPDGVTSIGFSAFEGCSSITSIIIPEGVTSIDSSTFRGCTSLESISIPDDIEHIGEDAFRECSSLTSIVIPSGVTYMGGGLFSGCTDLESVTLPLIIDPNNYSNTSPLERLGFESCENLKTINIVGNITTIPNRTFYGNNYGNPDSWNSRLTTMTIPDTVTSIGDEAFYGCSGLTALTLPDNLSSIGYSAFSGCSGLTSLSIPDGVTFIGGSAFEGCSSITSIIIPEGVTSIDSSTFRGCTSLESISIPDNIENIGEGAFRECSSLTSIVIPSGVTHMGSGLFSMCTNLESVTLPLIIDPNNYSNTSPLESLGLEGCENLTTINIVGNITTIPNRTFYGNNYGYPYSWNSRLTTITIPDTITSIGDEAFKGCSGLTALSIPNDVTSIGRNAFEDCGLKKIRLPAKITSIEERTFYRCSNLTKITVPAGVTTIGERAFRECRAMMSIVIPYGVTFLGDRIFEECQELTDIYYTGTEEQWNAIEKTNFWIPENCTIHFNYVPGSVNESEITGANIEIGSSLTINFYADLTEGFEDSVVRFTRNAKEMVVTGVYDSAHAAYKYSYTGITPQCMADDVKIELMYDDEVVDTVESYSIKSYCDRVASRTAEQNGMTEEKFTFFRRLLADMLEYGAQAQLYRNYNTDNLANSGDWVAVFKSTDFEVPETVKKVTGTGTDTLKFTGAGLELSNVNKIFFNFIADEGATLTLMRDNKIVNIYSVSSLTPSNDEYTIYSDGIFATGFEDVYTAILKDAGGNEVQRVTYSINSYVASMHTTVIGDLVKTMCSYGKSAKQYKNM